MKIALNMLDVNVIFTNFETEVKAELEVNPNLTFDNYRDEVEELSGYEVTLSDELRPFFDEIKAAF